MWGSDFSLPLMLLCCRLCPHLHSWPHEALSPCTTSAGEGVVGKDAQRMVRKVAQDNTPLGWRTQVTKCSATAWFSLKQKGTQSEHCCGTACEAFSALEGFCLHIPATYVLVATTWIAAGLCCFLLYVCFLLLWGERKKMQQEVHATSWRELPG